MQTNTINLHNVREKLLSGTPYTILLAILPTFV